MYMAKILKKIHRLKSDKNHREHTEKLLESKIDCILLQKLHWEIPFFDFVDGQLLTE